MAKDQEQSGELRELNKRLDIMVDRARARTKDFHGIWQDSHNYIFDNQLEGKTCRRRGLGTGADKLYLARNYPGSRLADAAAGILELPAR